jgi:hypothetical protein
MSPTAQTIRESVLAARAQLLALSAPAAPPAPETWSRQEILGHLIDSASNNHQRIVRGAYNAALDFPPYNQVAWVSVQRYPEADWRELVELFTLLNLHLCRVIEGLPAEALAHPVNIGKEAPVTVDFIITDYLRHLRHHLRDLLPVEPAAE